MQHLALAKSDEASAAQAELDEESARLVECDAAQDRLRAAAKADGSIRSKLEALGAGELAAAQPDLAMLAERGIFVSALERLALDTCRVGQLRAD